MQAVNRWLLIAATFVQAGCASLPPASAPSTAEIHQQHLASLAEIKNFELQGRIGVQSDYKGFSGSTQWQHEPQQDSIALFSPLGSQVASIKRNDAGVTLLTSDNKQYQAADAETLTEQNLGWRLPMRGLSDWVLGRPGPGASSESSWDHLGQLTRLKQDGWDIEYSLYTPVPEYSAVADKSTAAVKSLPTRITLRNAKLTLKLIVQQWQWQ